MIRCTCSEYVIFWDRMSRSTVVACLVIKIPLNNGDKEHSLGARVLWDTRIIISADVLVTSNLGIWKYSRSFLQCFSVANEYTCLEMVAYLRRESTPNPPNALWAHKQWVNPRLEKRHYPGTRMSSAIELLKAVLSLDCWVAAPLCTARLAQHSSLSTREVTLWSHHLAVWNASSCFYDVKSPTIFHQKQLITPYTRTSQFVLGLPLSLVMQGIT